MTRFLVVVVVVLLGGCKSLELPESPETLPQLIYQAPLPPWPVSSTGREINLDLKIFVHSDGTVRDAVLMRPTGFRNWDAQALQEVRRWRFSPAMARGKPVPLWIRQSVRIQFEPPLYMALAEIVVNETSLADSILNLLDSGESFESLARRFSVADSRERGGNLGKVDIRTYPAHIRRELADLREGRWSELLPLGQRYVIYKRLPQAVQARAD
ncbi:MAG: TonB family protein [Ignavibacteria bacterium]|nr:TonB family protein [Ignavibacteria bacterium]